MVHRGNDEALRRQIGTYSVSKGLEGLETFGLAQGAWQEWRLAAKFGGKWGAGCVVTLAILSPPAGLQRVYTLFLACTAECVCRVPAGLMGAHTCAWSRGLSLWV